MWNYEIKDNFLKNEHYHRLKNIFSFPKNWPNDEIILFYTIKENKTIDKSPIETPGFKQLVKEIHEDKKHEILNYLLEKDEERFIKYDRIQYELIISRKGNVLDYHTDLPNKLLTSITYIGDKNTGTLVSETPGSNEEEIPWKPNRCLLFLPEENTWHSAKTLYPERKIFSITIRS